MSRVVAGPFGTQILADLGAQVLRVLAPADRPDTGTGPLSASEMFDWSLNRGKDLVHMDLRDAAARDRFMELVRDADVVYDNFRPGVMGRLGLDHAALTAINPAVISCSLSGFGPRGPWRDRPAYDAVVQAASGAMDVTGGSGPDREPVRLGLPIGDLAAGLYAALGVLAALAVRDRTGQGQHIDVSMLDCQVALSTYRLPQCLDSGMDIRADQRRGGAGSTPYGPFLARDGRWITIGVAQQHWSRACHVLGLAPLEQDPKFATEPDRIDHQDELDDLVGRQLQGRDAAEWELHFQAAGLPCGVVRTIEEAFRLPQVVARRMLTELVDVNGRRCHVAASPIAGSSRRSRPPAPAVPAAKFAWCRRPDPAPPHDLGPVEDGPPLTGVRVLELDGDEPSKAVAAQIMADLGAEVVLVERPVSPRAEARSSAAVTPAEAMREGLHRGKKSVVLDFTTGRDRGRFLELAATASVIIDNHRPGVLARLGLDPVKVIERSPTLVWASISAFGQDGPLATNAAYDVNIQAMAGSMSLTGRRAGGMPMRWGYPIGGLAGALYGAVAVLAALRRVGQGMRGTWIDLSLLDCQLALQTYRVPQAIDLGLSFGPEPHSGGNGSRPYGPFATEGGGWFVLAIADTFWRGFCAAVGRPALADDPRFADVQLRSAHAAELNLEIGAIMAAHPAEHWQQVFLEHRLPGSPVYSLSEMAQLEQVVTNGLIRTIIRPDGATLHVPSFPVRMSRDTVGRYTPAPARGEHNHAFL